MLGISINVAMFEHSAPLPLHVAVWVVVGESYRQQPLHLTGGGGGCQRSIVVTCNEFVDGTTRTNHAMHLVDTVTVKQAVLGVATATAATTDSSIKSVTHNVTARKGGSRDPTSTRIGKGTTRKLNNCPALYWVPWLLLYPNV